MHRKAALKKQMKTILFVTYFVWVHRPTGRIHVLQGHNSRHSVNSQNYTTVKVLSFNIAFLFHIVNAFLFSFILLFIISAFPSFIKRGFLTSFLPHPLPFLFVSFSPLGSFASDTSLSLFYARSTFIYLLSQFDCFKESRKHL